MKEQIQQKARELGFDDCRITTAAPPESGGHFKDWLAARNHGEMAYLERNAAKRLQPQLVLPGAKSIITLAVSYEPGRDALPRVPLSPPLPVRRGEGWGEGSVHGPNAIARYARFADYHDILGQRLKALSEFIDSLGGPGARSLWYVDTGPLLERDLAQRAGLGFVGKHTNLISRKLGNWIFLAEILTTLELPPDAPEKNHCGSCARCLAACPTGAITAPFQLDARRCISYLTIELKGAIPVELRPAIGNRIYGCDDCLAVCPWNRFAREGQLMKAHARPDLAQPDLPEGLVPEGLALERLALERLVLERLVLERLVLERLVLEGLVLEGLVLDNAGFKKRFAATPMLRAKRRGLLRNVCVALGNVGDKSALPALEKATQDPEPLIAEHARWAVDQIKKRLEPFLA